MTMAMISPFGREVSPAEQLRQSPRLVPPRGGGVSSEKMAYDFFSHRKTPYSRRWPPQGHQGAHEVGGARPHPRGQGVAPLVKSCSQYFLYIWKTSSVKFQDFWSCEE